MTSWEHGLSDSIPMIRSPGSTSHSISIREDELADEPEQDHASNPLIETRGSGKNAAKSLLDPAHVAACGVCIICSVMGILVVSQESLAWYLSVGNLQLVVLGFLLSVMNLSTEIISSFTFLLLEARFGKSTLQNFSGLLSKDVLGLQLSFYWRGVLVLMTALPIGLSVAYKTFDGGSSSKSVNAASLLSAKPYYGLFAPPGVQQIESTGLTFLSNATVPFVLGTSPVAENGYQEPPVPTSGQAYRYNILVMNENATAVVDIPEPSYVSKIQAYLAIGESWHISASVYGTVATFSEDDLPTKNLSSFLNICRGARTGSEWTYLDLQNGQRIGFQTPYGLGPNRPLGNTSRTFTSGDNSLMYFSSEPTNLTINSCDVFVRYAQPIRVTRQICKVSWTFTRGGFQLDNGSCDRDSALSQPAAQKIINAENTLILPYFLTPHVTQLLSPFEGGGATRKGSRWVRPYMATAAAGTFWSRATLINGPARTYWYVNGTLAQYANATRLEVPGHTLQELSYLYPVEDSVVYVRPALRKSVWLYTVLLIQPFLTILFMITSLLLYSTPISTTFGLVSILSGVDRTTLDSIAGAGQSGELQAKTRSSIQPVTRDGLSAQILEYKILTQAKDFKRSGYLIRHIKYG